MILLTFSFCGYKAIPDRPILSLKKLYFFDQFTLYFKVYPKKLSSCPLFTWKIFVFSGDSCSPLSAKNSTTAGLINFSITLRLVAITMKSSAYRIVFTLKESILVLIPFSYMFFLRCLPPLILEIEFRIWSSRPFRVKFPSIGLIIPPCGVPFSVFIKAPSRTAPAFSHCDTIILWAFGKGKLIINQS